MAKRSKQLFARNKPLVEIYTSTDYEGNQIEFREDSDQHVKYREILNLLFEAGYYKAQVQGISPFDKIVGGITWCIEYCDVDIDINLLFEENLSIGKKIALTEKIVAVLPALKCPHTIEPHQIQGLDFINILPVIEWLIKHSDELRKESATELKHAAVWQYERRNIFDCDRLRISKERDAMRNIHFVLNLYKPSRVRKREGKMLENELEQVISTLSEYDQRVIQQSTNTANPKEMTDDELHFLYEFEQSLADPTHLTTLKLKVANQIDKEEQTKREIHYDLLENELKNAPQLVEESQKSKVIHDLEITKNVLAEKKRELDDLEENQLNQINSLNESALEKKSTVKELRQYLVDLLSANVEDLSAENLQRMKSNLMSMVRERMQLLKIVEAKKLKLNSLENDVKSLKVENDKAVKKELTSEEEQAFNEAEEKLKLLIGSLKQQLAKVVREVRSLSDTVDDIPAQNEMMQYEKRFMELYEQIADKHKETKMLCELYNTKCDIKSFITKEISLLNSIVDNYKEATSSSKKCDQFMQQLENMTEWANQRVTKCEKLFKSQQAKCNQLNCEYLELIDAEKEYYAALKELAAERKRLNDLMSQ